jgi:hypothetical protein
MLEQFWATMRVAWVAGQIAARHRLGSPRVLAYHHPLVETLFNTLKTESSGVFVHWGVYESGKSTAANQAAWRLQEEAERQVIGFNGFEFSWLKPPMKRLRHAIGVPEDMDDKPFSEFFTRDTTIIIDHFDMFLRDKDNVGGETLEWVMKLIEESEQTKKFNMLLIVTSWERAEELVDAGCKLVPGDAPAKWTRDELETLLASLSDKSRSIMSEKEDELLRLSTLSGTPGFLTFSAHGERINPKRAAMHDLEWRRGMKGLYKQAHLDLSPHVEVGRFPDRNGVYHHEDLQEFQAQRLHI